MTVVSDPKPIIIVQGGQYGSEAKGAVTGWLAVNRQVSLAVRTGAVNAGHTVYYKPDWASQPPGTDFNDRVDAKPFVNQQLPVAWVNPRTSLVIGPGAMIEPDTLWREIAMINRAQGVTSGRGVIDRLFIDYRCGLHDAMGHAARSAESDRHHKIGATGKGCSEAIIDKIRRRGDADYILARDHQLFTNTPLKDRLYDTTALLMQAYDHGQQILLEGTQGAGLDLHLGPYPYTTHKPCNAAQWVVEAGLSPSLDYEVVLVMRTYPIRVAGNSGPMHGETDWVTLGRDINHRRMAADMDPICDPDAITRFYRVRNNLATATGFPLQGRFWLYDEVMRVKWRDAISELDKQTLEMLPVSDVDELRKLFEMTTVTRKLRRVGVWDSELAHNAILWNRPAWVAMTFCNYLEPTLWGWDGNESDCPDPDAFGRLQSWLEAVEEADLGGTPIRLCSFGPEPQHFAQRLTADELVHE